MRFTKMHGLGNDYIYVNCFEETVEKPVEAAKRLSDRRFGIGSDGLILICPSEVADFRMVMYNADGSQAQMCGNGIRCVGKYVYDRGLTSKTRVTVETGAGIKTLELTVAGGVVQLVRVDMGEPVWEPARIPVRSDLPRFLAQPVEVAGRTWTLSCVSMGNPHAVTFVDDVDALPLEKLGPEFENHLLFPERINTEFVQKLDGQTLKMRVWERGSGETWACGTGACAVYAAASALGCCRGRTTLQLRGGELLIDSDVHNNHIFMTGPATFVFDGTVDL